MDENKVEKYLAIAKERGGVSTTKPKQWESENNMRWHIQFLYHLTKKIKPDVIVELGTFIGGSFYTFLAGLVENNKGHIHTIDIVDRSEYLQEANESKTFFTHIVGDTKKVDTIPNIDFLLLDTSHSYEQTAAEWEHWEKYVKVGGLIFFHDTQLKDSKGVYYGVHWFIIKLWKKESGRFVRLYNLGAEINGDLSGLEIWLKLIEIPITTTTTTTTTSTTTTTTTQPPSRG